MQDNLIDLELFELNTNEEYNIDDGFVLTDSNLGETSEYTSTFETTLKGRNTPGFSKVSINIYIYIYIYINDEGLYCIYSFVIKLNGIVFKERSNYDELSII